MNGQKTIDLIGLNKAIYTTSKDKKLSESKSIVLNQAKEFGIDAVYFNTDENENSFPAIFLKKINSFDIDSLKEIASTHKKAWNFKKVLFLYVYSETEIRIYNCSEKPIIITKDNFDYDKKLQNIEIKSYKFSDKEQIQELNRLFSTIAIDTGIIWTLEEAQFVRNKINLQRRVDKYLVDSLVNTAKQLEQQGLEINFIHKIILRSLFLLYLEDREATDEKFYSKIRKGAKSYFDILNDVNSTYDLFDKLEEHFNGNVFTLEDGENISTNQLQLIKKCFISGNDNTPQINLFEDWRLFDFSIIQIELLSEIYENFLFKTHPELKKKTGTYYTPPSLVEFILNEKLPINKGETNYDIKILDPSCGSGIFLVESFKRLVKRYENSHNEKLTDFNKLKKLLTDNIFGIELHPQAIKVTAFSLYLALVDNLNPKNIWQNKNHSLPNLINNPEDKSLKEQGTNLFCRDTISENKEIENIEFNLVVGNPPFGTTGLLESVKSYCKQEGFAQEMVLPFLHKSTKFAPKGEVALIFNTKVLTNTGGTYQNFRKWLFNDCYVEKVYNFSILRNAKKNFGGQLFGDATGPISIVYYQKEQPINPSDKIAYYAPKTYIKSNIIEGLNIDFTDLKHLPREECQKPDTKIWKVAMWGGMNDWNLIKQLSNSKFENINDFNKSHNIKSGVGFQLLTQKKDKPKYSDILTKLPYLDSKDIKRYNTSDNVLKNIKKSIKTPRATNFYKNFYNLTNLDDLESLTAFRRLGDIEAFTNPHIIIKKGLEKNAVCASFIDIPCSFRDGVYGFYSDTKNISKLHLLMSYFNSKISSYFLFMTISSYGIEREQIMKNEYLSIPINLNKKQEKAISKASMHIIEKLNSENFLNDEIENKKLEFYIVENVDNIIYESFNLTKNDIALLNDGINYSLDLFHKQEKSKALLPVLQEQVNIFSTLISNELNNFLDGQDLFSNATIYNNINRFSPLMMIKISFDEKKSKTFQSNEFIDEELKKLDKHLWEEKATNIYFRKKLNYKTGNDIYIIRPNQRRFWSQSMALEDASELILEILNEN
ncbi:class I SAM-dependent DNA methyltransferase [Mesonia ostreae]|uniref:site-specific DNA-methyltransferase (adenine-specific) n=1 Tax=Mesonia ostreae TaxID=861110 RepID=A0ABU2KJL1_9FLAO|nr:N-6 DNA methylase [Mesonia ostreae]MDT0294902.1 N-6 DNA methylase [Mesonia ostreae]